MRISSIASVGLLASIASCAPILLLACAGSPQRLTAPPAPVDDKAAVASITAEDLLRHTRALASDEFGGRAPGTEGEERTIKYLVDEMKRLGLRSANPDGSYIQEVPLVSTRSRSKFALSAPGAAAVALATPADFVAFTRRGEPVDIQGSEIVFVGYGVVAPEYGWDDYKDIDVRGKTILMLIGDPPLPDGSDPQKLDESMFKGKAMTYYGRWTYKYEIAAEKGAAAAIVIHQTAPASYGWEVVVNSFTGDNFDLASSARVRARAEGWITVETARSLCARAKQDFARLEQAALKRDFKPVALGLRADIGIEVETKRVTSRNVAAIWPGRDERLKDEVVVYSAHWDHLGRDDRRTGDQVFNGAVDNALGVAQWLELAEAYTKLPQRPRRSILFLAVTAEERGLLGARHYVQNPLLPLARTVADINMDAMAPRGRTRDLLDVGLGQSTLDDQLSAMMAARGRVLLGDPQPERGAFYRADHFEFARAGVPAIDTTSGVDVIGKPPGTGMAMRTEFYAKHYHQVTDEVHDDWDLAGNGENLELLFLLGRGVADADAPPSWKDGSEFKAQGEARRAGAR